MIILLVIRYKRMTSLRIILANNLKANRRKCGMSQAKLAEKAEISPQYIAMIELSRQFPSPEVLERIAGVLGIEGYELFSVSASPQKELERLRQDIITEIKQTFSEMFEQALKNVSK
ncbi:MAG: helix-turn-helix transcriptional regulator [Treponema sp.]|jgi:transcriptional regulator with XRE-family HTH domain|nr:helix-turn-helix transcriptional regulator [Treponema sp.]